MTRAELLKQLESLAVAVREGELSDEQIESVSSDLRCAADRLRRRGPVDPSALLGLKGLGKETWRAIDVDEYVRNLRE